MVGTALTRLCPPYELNLEKVKQEEMSNNNSPLPADRIPVIVGIGEIVDRPKDIAAGLEPLALLEQAVRRAEADSGAKLLGELGSLDVVNFLSWRYRDPEKQRSEERRVGKEWRAGWATD